MDLIHIQYILLLYIKLNIMIDNNIKSNGNNDKGFVRLGGAVILLGFAVHIIANMVLKTFPSESFTLIELQEYLSNEASTWAIVHGMRYIAIVCIIIFSAALYMKTSCNNLLSKGWGIVGLLGSALMMSNLMIANGIEILAFFNFDRLSEQEELFWLLFNLTRILFTAEVVAWSILILGFSMAGWFSTSIPKWIFILGLISALLCFLSSIFIINILNNSWALLLIEIGSLAGLWNYPVVEIFLELALFLIGAIIYFKSSNFKRKIAYWLLIVFLLIAHLMNLFGSPPPNIMAVAWSANLMWIIVIWAWWIEKKRTGSS